MRLERAVVSHDRPSCAVFVQNSTHARDLGVVFRFVLRKQFVDVSTHVLDMSVKEPPHLIAEAGPGTADRIHA